jgi:hypothetical protein
MKTQNRSILLFVLIALLFLPACSSAAPKTTTPLTGEQASQVQALADPLADSILTSVVNTDFTLYTKNFDDVMLKMSTQNSFDSMVSGLNKQFGAYQSRMPGKTYLIEQSGQKYYLVIYPLKWEKGSLVLQLSLHYEAPHKIAGLYFK